MLVKIPNDTKDFPANVEWGSAVLQSTNTTRATHIGTNDRAKISNHQYDTAKLSNRYRKSLIVPKSDNRLFTTRVRFKLCVSNSDFA